MISYVDPSIQAFLNGLNQIQQQAQTAQTQLTTGLKINQVSDAPDQISPLLQVQAQIARVNQANTNLQQVQAETNAGESALQSAVQVLDRVQTLGAQGQSNTNTASTRATISGQLNDALTNLVNLANTATGGRYIFGGDADQTPPYSINLAQANPVSAYAGTASTRQVQLADGSLISISLTAQQIFDSPVAANNVFAAVNALRTAMQNNDQAGIDAAIPLVSSAAAYLNQQLAVYGTVQDNVNNAVTGGQQSITQLTAQLSGIEDANAAQAIAQLNLANLHQQAALGAQAQMPRTSLFNYLG